MRLEETRGRGGQEKETDVDRSLRIKTKERKKSPAKQSAMHICVDADVSVLLQSA